MNFTQRYTFPNAKGVHVRICLEAEGDRDSAAAEHRKMDAALRAMGAVPSGDVRGEATAEGETSVPNELEFLTIVPTFPPRERLRAVMEGIRASTEELAAEFAAEAAAADAGARE